MSEPRQLGRYEILGLLGRGGMGAVYKAHDPVLDRIVALKVVSPVHSGSAEAAESLERFRREARAAGRLSHPNIVSVHDLDRDTATDTPFIVMEHVDGISLATVLSENPTLPLAQALEIVEQVGVALEDARWREDDRRREDEDSRRDDKKENKGKGRGHGRGKGHDKH
jgi:eukaryotic-like serine/threonine-protein kinase